MLASNMKNENGHCDNNIWHDEIEKRILKVLETYSIIYVVFNCSNPEWETDVYHTRGSFLIRSGSIGGQISAPNLDNLRSVVDQVIADIPDDDLKGKKVDVYEPAEYEFGVLIFPIKKDEIKVEERKG